MYRRILTRDNAWFSLTGLVARLPISMMGLGIVLLAQATTGSYAFAGSVSAVAVLANAALAIPQGRLIDRLGQGVVLRVCITVWGLALVGVVVSLQADWPRMATFLLAAVMGGAMPSVGTCSRARWSYVLGDDDAALHTAFSFEAVADEAVFVVGPLTATMLATQVHPSAALLTALAVGVVGTYVFASLRATEPRVQNRQAARRSDREPLPWPVLAPLCVSAAALGVLFGAAEVVTVAFADEHGHKSVAGMLLGLWALGSATAGLIAGVYAGRVPPRSVLRLGSLCLFGTTIPLFWVPSIPVMAVVLLLGGLSISPTLIAAMSLAEQALPDSRMTEGMAFLNTGLSVGIAPGAALAGWVIDAHGASAAYLVASGGALLAALAALTVPRPVPAAELASAELASRSA